MADLNDLFPYLKALTKNNNREWFTKHKSRFAELQEESKLLLSEIQAGLSKTDVIDETHLYRIYRDIRFSKDKTPYKTYISMHLGRAGVMRRGGYYLQLEPGHSFLAGGFWAPEPKDLKRIRDEFAMDDAPIRKILNQKSFRENFGTLQGDELKTAPAGYDRDHPAIDLIRKKQFIVTHNFKDDEVLSKDFSSKVVKTFEILRPFLDYMSEVLTTNINGEKII